MELLWKLFKYLLGINNKEKLSFFNAIYFLNEKRKGEFHAPIFKEKKFFSILLLKIFFFFTNLFFSPLRLSLFLFRAPSYFNVQFFCREKASLFSTLYNGKCLKKFYNPISVYLC